MSATAVKVLIIVDVQVAFSPPAALLKKIETYARGFDRRVFTRFVNPPGSLFRTTLKQTSCAPNTRDVALLVEPQRGDLILDKTGYGLNVRHIAKVKALGAKTVTVCGLDTDACVLGVMFSLFDAGIVCVARRDLCWSSTGLQREGIAIIDEQFPLPGT